MKARGPLGGEREAVGRAREAEKGAEDAIGQLLLRRTALSEGEIALFAEVFPDLMDAHFDQVWGVLRRRGLRDADVDDLGQEVFATFFHRACLEGFPDSIGAKLHALAAGKALNHLRDAARETLGIPSSGSEVPGSIPDLARLLDHHEFRRQLLPVLTPEHLAVVDAVLLRDLTHEEAAAELGIPRTTLSSRLLAARRVIVALAEVFFSPSQRG